MFFEFHSLLYEWKPKKWGEKKKKHEREWKKFLFLLLPNERKEKVEKKFDLTLEEGEIPLGKMKARWLRNIVWKRKEKCEGKKAKGRDSREEGKKHNPYKKFRLMNV